MPHRIRFAIAVAALAATATPLAAQSPATSPPSVSFDAYVQTQYERTAANDRSQDRVFFRRIVLTVGATPVALGERLIVKDAYLRY